MKVAQREHHETVPNLALAKGLAGFRAVLITPEPSSDDTVTPQVEVQSASSAPSDVDEVSHVVSQVDSHSPAPVPPSPVIQEAQHASPQDRPHKQKPSYFSQNGNGGVDKAISPVTQPARAPQRFEDMPLRSLRFVDLGARVTMQKESGIICRFILRDGNSFAVFTLSVVPTNRVRFTCRESTVSFAPIFTVGSELFQDEIWNMRDPSPERQMATRVFQQVLDAIDERMTQRRNDRNQGSQGRLQARPSSTR